MVELTLGKRRMFAYRYESDHSQFPNMIRVETLTVTGNETPEELTSLLGDAVGNTNVIHLDGPAPHFPDCPLVRALKALEELSHDDGLSLDTILQACINAGAQVVLNAIRAGKLSIDEIKASQPLMRDWSE